MQDEERSLEPILALDVSEGRASPVTARWPDPRPAAGDGAFRWIHLDITQRASAIWLHANLPEIAAAALLQGETRPRFEPFDEWFILTQREVSGDPVVDGVEPVALRLYGAPGTLVTARRRPVRSVETLRAELLEGQGPRSQGELVARLVRLMVERLEDATDRLDDRAEALEDGQGAEEVSALRVAAIKLRRYAAPQRDAIAEMANFRAGWLDPQWRARMRELANRAARVVEELDSIRHRLEVLADRPTAEMHARLARNNYMLAIVATIFLPLSFIAGLFGVNLDGIPGAEHPLAFAVLTAALTALAALLLGVLKWLRWF